MSCPPIPIDSSLKETCLAHPFCESPHANVWFQLRHTNASNEFICPLPEIFWRQSDRQTAKQMSNRIRQVQIPKTRSLSQHALLLPILLAKLVSTLKASGLWNSHFSFEFRKEQTVVTTPAVERCQKLRVAFQAQTAPFNSFTQTERQVRSCRRCPFKHN